MQTVLLEQWKELLPQTIELSRCGGYRIVVRTLFTWHRPCHVHMRAYASPILSSPKELFASPPMEHRPLQFSRQSLILRRKLPQEIARESASDSPVLRGLNPAQRTAVTTLSNIVQILAPRNSCPPPSPAPPPPSAPSTPPARPSARPFWLIAS